MLKQISRTIRDPRGQERADREENRLQDPLLDVEDGRRSQQRERGCKDQSSVKS